MKKIITVAVAFTVCALSVVFAADGLQSANVVGWQDKQTKNNMQAMAPVFFTVGVVDAEGNGSWKLSDLTVGGYENAGKGGFSGAEVSIQVLNNAGVTQKTYVWNEGVWGKMTAGWYDDYDKLVGGENEVSFKQGQGLWIRGKEGRFLKMAGEVFMDDTTFTLHDDMQMLANPYATKLKLSALKVTGYTGGFSGAEVSIQMLNEHGVTKHTYVWNEGIWGKMEAGWYDDYDKLVCAANGNDVEFEPGQGLWVRGKEGRFIEVTSPLTQE